MGNASTKSASRYSMLMEGILRLLLVLAALTVAGFGIVERWRLATSLPWQTDELPLLMRFTGVTGKVASEETAQQFTPTPYLLRTGALRALQPPPEAAALHTTANFWTNLSIFFGGVKPWVARVLPFLFAIGAMIAVAYATRAAGGGLTAVVIAVGLVSLSPLSILYAAQARGYAEAMFLTPLLLLCLDALRRKPRDLARALLVLLVALQLSLTLYTMWVFWVLPIMLIALWRLPAEVSEGEPARQTRFTLALLLASLIGVMGIFTLDRWSSLSFTAGHMGDRLTSLPALLDFAGQVARMLTPMKEMVAIPAFLGLVILLRSQCRWWGLAILVSLLIPLVFALTLGTAGYVRNFAYLLVPLALLAGLGLERFLIALLERRHRRLVHATTAVLLLAGMLMAWDGAARDARSMILPNWGGAVQSIMSRPPSLGLRWIAPCLTHHWPISWYQGPEAAKRVAEADERQPMELVIGTTTDSEGREIVYREDAKRQAIVEAPVPQFISANHAAERVHGVNLRRWMGMPLIEGAKWPTDGAVSFFWVEDGMAAERWASMLDQLSTPLEFLNFKPVPTEGRLLRQVIVHARNAPDFLSCLGRAYAGHPLHVRSYAMTPITGPATPPVRPEPTPAPAGNTGPSKQSAHPISPPRICAFERDQQF